MAPAIARCYRLAQGTRRDLAAGGRFLPPRCGRRRVRPRGRAPLLVARRLLSRARMPESTRSLIRTLRRPRHGLQVRLSPITVAPGSEREVCQLVTLPNRRAMDANEITMAMPSGATYTSHHFAIFLYQGDNPEGIPSGPFDRVGCAGVGDQVVSPILAFVQRPRQTIRFPSGVAVALGPHQRLLLNSHYLNGGTEPVTIDVPVDFPAPRQGTVRHHTPSFQLR